MQHDDNLSDAHPHRPLAVLFGAAVLLQALFVLWIAYFVTVDGPTHLGGGAAVVGAISNGHGLAAQFATFHLLPLSNLIPELPLGYLADWLGPQRAEKLVVVGYVVGFPFAVAWAIRGVAPSRWWLAFFAIPLTFSFALNHGFYNFCYGLIGLVVGAGYVARHRERWTVRSTVVLGVIATITYVAHVLPFVELVILCGLVGLFALLPQTGLGWRAGLRQAIPLGLAVAPGLMLAALLVAARPPAVGPSTFSPVASLAATFALAWGMVTFDVRELVFTTLVALILATVVLFAVRDRLTSHRLEPGDVYLLFGIVAIVEVALVPSGVTLGAGGSFVAQRLGFIPVLAVLLWVAGRKLPRRAPPIVAIGCVVAAAGIIGLRVPAYATLSDEVEAYVAVAPCVATGSTMLQVNVGRVVPGSLDRTDQLSDEAGRLTALTAGWPIANVEFEVGFFPLQNREANNLYATLIPQIDQTTPVWEPIEAIPPSIDLDAYERAVGRPIDYLLVFGRNIARPETLVDPRWTSLEAQIRRGYQLVTTSTNGRLEVYERTGSSAADRGARQRAASPGQC